MAWISTLLRKNPQFMEQLQNRVNGFAQAAQQTQDAAAQGDDGEVSLLGGRLHIKKSVLFGNSGCFGGWARKLRAAATAQNTNNQEGASYAYSSAGI